MPSLSSSRLSRGVLWSLCSQASALSDCLFIEQRACPRAHELTRLTEQDVGLRPALLYCRGRAQCCPWWPVAKQACFAFLFLV